MFDDDSSSHAENGAGVNVGVGLDVPITQLVSLGAGAEYQQTIGIFNNPGFVTAIAFHLGS